MLKYALALALSLAPWARAWGPEGHETVAHIAEDRLSPAAKARIGEMLGGAPDLARISSWADHIRHARENTAPWHYIDLEVRRNLSEKDEQAACANGDCVVGQIKLDIQTLKDPRSGPGQRVEALKFLVHFVGDLHQPLHCADDSDRGGNDKLVRFRKPGAKGKGVKIKLHTLWDHILEPKSETDPRALATRLGQTITPAQAKEWGKGTPEDWAWESYRLAKTEIYPGLAEGPSRDRRGTELPEAYYNGAMRALAESRLQKAGIRLAAILEGIFGGPPARAHSK